MRTTSLQPDQANAPRQAPPLDNPQSIEVEAPHATGSSEASASMPRPQQPSTLRLARREPHQRVEQVSKGLGWFSITLGLAELLTPRLVARATGVNYHPVLMRALGARELVSGAGILSQPRSAGWLWSRVAGDAMDLALLGIAAASAGKSRARRQRLALASAAVAGVAVVDIMSSLKQAQQASPSLTMTTPGQVEVEKSITINRSPEECYQFWRDFENFPRFMKHLEDVQVMEGDRSHWRAKGPAGTHVEWDAEITVDHPDQLLAWHSLEGADIQNAGTVRFEPAAGGRGTVVRVDLHYKPPLGQAGAMIAKLFGEEPALQIDQDLRRFKQLIETGEIATTVGQPSGPRGLITRLLFRQGEPG